MAGKHCVDDIKGPVAPDHGEALSTVYTFDAAKWFPLHTISLSRLAGEISYLPARHC